MYDHDTNIIESTDSEQSANQISEQYRPVGCDCPPSRDPDGLPCWPCRQIGFEKPNVAAVREQKYRQERENHGRLCEPEASNTQ